MISRSSFYLVRIFFLLCCIPVLGFSEAGIYMQITNSCNYPITYQYKGKSEESYHSDPSINIEQGKTQKIYFSDYKEPKKEYYDIIFKVKDSSVAVGGFEIRLYSTRGGVRNHMEISQVTGNVMLSDTENHWNNRVGNTPDLLIASCPFSANAIGLGEVTVQRRGSMYTYTFSVNPGRCTINNDTKEVQCTGNIGYKYMNNSVTFFCQRTSVGNPSCPWVELDSDTNDFNIF
ncbi:hypothetical protein [Fangia hongkongensis]|uniref:hypothetical protein n=1 Tax=Fangia hongkongensis TaxID=270495 RepID=UPI0003A3F853|nr:hypothetical protein [Fangia hongkongensis]MBK2124869.1 hypothetical protein [Fangia hongkongensis]